MTDSKSHLVERVAERLLQSGALEESAAHLLGTDRAGADRAGADRAAGAADPGPGARGGRNPEPDAEAPNVPHDEAPAARSYSALDLLDRPGVPEEVAPFLGAPATLRSLELPSGPVSIDAVALERAGMVDWSRTVDTTHPSYYKWTQWVFLQLLKRGLAFEGTSLIEVMVDSAVPLLYAQKN